MTTMAKNLEILYPGGTPERPRRRGLLLALLVLAVAIVIAVVVIRPGDGGGEDREPLPKGLVLGAATATFESSTREIGGVPRGFPHTEAGAVEAAAAQISVMRSAAAFLPTSVRSEVVRDLNAISAAEAAEIEAVARKFQASQGLDSNGQPASAQPGDRYYSDCLPQFGAYLVRESSADRVDVQVWMPCVEGIGSPSNIDNLRIDWDWYFVPMGWSTDDWRALPVPADVPPGPVPADKLHPNVTVAERAELLGAISTKVDPENPPQWELFQGYSEKWPSDLLGPEPGEK